MRPWVDGSVGRWVLGPPLNGQRARARQQQLSEAVGRDTSLSRQPLFAGRTTCIRAAHCLLVPPGTVSTVDIARAECRAGRANPVVWNACASCSACVGSPAGGKTLT